MDKLLRNAHIGIIAAAVLLVVGFWPAHRSEAAMSALGFAAMFVAFGVFFALSIRDERARCRDDSRNSPHP